MDGLSEGGRDGRINRRLTPRCPIGIEACWWLFFLNVFFSLKTPAILSGFFSRTTMLRHASRSLSTIQNGRVLSAFHGVFPIMATPFKKDESVDIRLSIVLGANTNQFLHTKTRHLTVFLFHPCLPAPIPSFRYYKELEEVIGIYG